MNRRIQLALKRAFDIVVSLTVLILLSPIMALIAPALCNSEAVLHRAGHQTRRWRPGLLRSGAGRQRRQDLPLLQVPYHDSGR
jgi:hypothetical protein